jgi:hypothetical protein
MNNLNRSAVAAAPGSNGGLRSANFAPHANAPAMPHPGGNDGNAYRPGETSGTAPVAHAPQPMNSYRAPVYHAPAPTPAYRAAAVYHPAPAPRPAPAPMYRPQPQYHAPPAPQYHAYRPAPAPAPAPHPASGGAPHGGGGHESRRG